MHGNLAQTLLGQVEQSVMHCTALESTTFLQRLIQCMIMSTQHYVT